ncbi:MAG TPA: hypothetical protein VGE13_04045 [Candidatus Saccharimonadales bacterium]
MRAVIVYRAESDHRRPVEEFLHDFSRQTGNTVEVYNPDDKEGQEFCRVYDVVEYPTMIALADDGQLLATWRGLPLPTISEVSYYA